ncbi:hypothetical protein ACUH9O_05690 [Dermabacteraceae bacterium P13103]
MHPNVIARRIPLDKENRYNPSSSSSEKAAVAVAVNTQTQEARQQ